MHFDLISKYHIKINEYFCVVENGFLSSNRLSHTHILKSVIALIFQPFGLSNNVYADTGLPFLSYLPQELILLAAILFVVQFLSLIKILLFTVNRVSSEARGAWITVVLPAAFVVLKSSIDGGCFNLHFLVALIAILIGFHFPKRPFLPYWATFLFGFTGVLILIANYDESVKSLNYHAYDLLEATLFFFILPKIILDYKERSNIWLGYLLLFIASFILLQKNYFLVGDFYKFYRQIPSGSEVFITSDRRSTFPFEPLVSQNRLKLYRTKSKGNERIGDYYKIHNTSPSYPLVQVDKLTCDKNAPINSYGMVITDEKIIDSGSSSWLPLIQNFTVQPCKPGERCNYRYEATLMGCADPYTLAVVNARLESLGLKRWILIPHTKY